MAFQAVTEDLGANPGSDKLEAYLPLHQSQANRSLLTTHFLLPATSGRPITVG